MGIPTHFLSVLVVICAAVPTQLLRIGAATGAGPGRARPAGSASPWPVLSGPVALGLVAALVWFVAPASGVTGAPAGWWWCAAAVGLGLLAPLVEFGVGAVAALVRGRRVTGLRLHERAAAVAGPLAAAALLATVLAAIAEEVIFRGVLLHLLHVELAWPVPAAIGLTAVLYGVNHLYFGRLAVAQKAVTGVLLGGLYAAAGYSVLVPVIAHVTQNLAVLVLLPRLTSPASPAGAAGQPGGATTTAGHR